MTTMQTLRDPKVKRLLADAAPQNLVETAAPETSLEWHERYEQYCRDFIENQKQDGTPDEELVTVPEIVAICKEVRAERYAKKQKNSAGC